MQRSLRKSLRMLPNQNQVLNKHILGHCAHLAVVGKGQGGNGGSTVLIPASH